MANEVDNGDAALVRAARHRKKLRAQGLRQIQVSIVDTRKVEFAREANHQSLRIAQSADSHAILRLLQGVRSWN
jgi:hypothetical protein